jgi:hypothetical protein
MVEADARHPAEDPSRASSRMPCDIGSVGFALDESLSRRWASRPGRVSRPLEKTEA